MKISTVILSIFILLIVAAPVAAAEPHGEIGTAISTHKPPPEPRLTAPPTDTIAGPELEVSTDPVIILVAAFSVTMLLTSLMVRR